MRMDNATFLRISQNKSSGQLSDVDFYPLTDQTKPFNLPLYNNGKTASGLMPQTSDIIGVKAAPTLVSLGKNLDRMVQYALKLQEQGQFTE